MSRRIVYSLRRLYDGESEEAHRFRYALLCFDIVTILFVIVTSFTSLGGIVPYIDVAIGVVVLADLGARFAIAPRKIWAGIEG